MLNLTSHSFNQKDEPILQQLQNHLQYLSQDKKAAKPCVRACAIAMTAIYEATEPSAIEFDHVCDCCPKFNKAIALLQDLSKPGLLAVARAIAEELAVLEQLQGASR
ncbi:hypothetical protein [Chlorogloea sp. CCALA 695]|uniref:hypothetical protein n=1 Tax=Chlorogloea sp. CCALA 695 TaxID=2107693 RepID=UPI000D04C6D2|nr:hypothetical protein [Chlorogloea sp. CCALA 695]PSB30124.1 hypothetical protein C7B70_17155 [Chlorogloea sp. CCALA 695]